MISDPGNNVAVKLLGNFCYLKTHKSFPYAGNVGSHSFGLPLHSWVYKQGWWHLNILEMPLWTQIRGPQQVAPRSQLTFPIKGTSHSMDREPVPTDTPPRWVTRTSWKENFLSIFICFCNLKIYGDFSYWGKCCSLLSTEDFIYSGNSPEWDSKCLKSLKQKF